MGIIEILYRPIDPQTFLDKIGPYLNPSCLPRPVIGRAKLKIFIISAGTIIPNY